MRLDWILSHLCNFTSGLFFASIGYFLPIKGVIHIVIIAITIDLITGIIAARYRGEGIKSSKLWRTIYKLLYSVIIIALTYAIDKEMGFLDIYKFMAWLIAGFEVWSILENAGSITDHKLFRILKHVMEDKVKEVTGINLNEEQDAKVNNSR